MMAYIGICGGAKISGSVSYYGLAPLDLLQGAEVLYDVNCSRAQVCTTQNAVQITTGCAVAIYMWQNRRQGICFPVVKNAGQWWPFAEQNTMALQDFVVQKCNTPEEFSFEEGNLQLDWYFRLVDTASTSRMKNGQQSNRMKNGQGCYSSILSGSGSELHYCQGIESTSAMHGIASMYRYLKQFEADDASRQVYFTEPAAVIVVIAVVVIVVIAGR